MFLPWSMKAVLLALLAYVSYIVAAYIYDSRRLRRFPSLSVAALTDWWLVWHHYHHARTTAVHRAHLRHGNIVRIAPNHVSFADVQACRDIYGHGSKTGKEDFYQSFLATHPNISDSQDQATHNLKRRRLAHAFSQSAVVQFEGLVRRHLEVMVDLCDRNGSAALDMKHQILLFLYDISCVTIFGECPEFLRKGSAEAVAENMDGEISRANLYEVLRTASHTATCSGVARHLKPLLHALVPQNVGWTNGDKLRNIVIHLLRKRLREDTKRLQSGEAPMQDFMTSLLWDRNTVPLCLEFGELVTEAQNLLSAAGENTEIATVNTIYLLASNPSTADDLRQELDQALVGSPGTVPLYDAIKNLPFLRACIDEALRLRPSIEMGLPRVVPAAGMSVSGHWLEGGTAVSVSTRTIHRDESVFGEKPEEFVPQRWLAPESPQMQRGFLAFSQGGRGCIGRNIAHFEMLLIVATIFWNFEVQLAVPDQKLEIWEAFSAHTMDLPLVLRRRRRAADTVETE